MERISHFPIPMESIPWDTEGRNDLLPKIATIRDTMLFLTAPLLAWMEQIWGYFAFVRTRTFVETGEIWVAEAQENDPGAVEVKRVGTQNSAYFSFWRPLRKLNITVPADRQFDLEPKLVEVNEQLRIFVIRLSERQSRTRDIGDGTGGAAPQEAAAAWQAGGNTTGSE